MNEFDSIRPYEPEEMKEAFEALLADRHFNAVMKGFAPWLPKGVRNGLLRLAFTGVKTPLDFQKRFMKPVVKHIIRKHTDGCTYDDKALTVNNEQLVANRDGRAGGNHNYSLFTINYKLDQRFTFLSNHRDIVLDSALLDVMLVEHGYPTTVEIGIGNNLLIYPWIERLVRMNKAFIVRRGLSLRETLVASQLMSRYIHYAVTKKRENIWLAQREGRAKDSSDHTQDAVLKMLAMGGDLKELNIVPLTISYEYDPCDYLKAQEMQLKRDNPSFKKSRQDDLDNMRTGIFGYKGRVHYQCGTPVNAWIDELTDLPKTEFYTALAKRIDRELHCGYRLYPCNYIALDMLNEEGSKTGGGMVDGGGSKTGSDEPSGWHKACPYTGCPYTGEERQQFEAYLKEQIAKIQLPQKDEPFLRKCILTMYANPVLNKVKSEE